MSDYPTQLQYANTHEWLRVEGEIAVVGISDYAQGELGDIVYVELPELDSEVEAGGEIAIVESVKAASDIYSPIAGTVVEINPALEDSPETVNEDPYGNGWFFKIKISDGTSTEHLLTADAYQQMCESES